MLTVFFMAAPTAAFANGESLDGFPNWSERVLMEWMNRARSDPQTDLAACSTGNCPDKACYTPKAPRYLKDDFNHSARFHTSEMAKNNFLDYPSHCTLFSNIDALYPATCDGSASCACTQGAVTTSDEWTDPFTRIGLFGSTGIAEIEAAQYSSPDAMFYGMLYSQSSSSACGASTYREYLLQGSGNTAGPGYVVAGGSSLFSTYAVFDFGGTVATTPKIPSGSHSPQQAASVDAWVNWYDTAGPSVTKIDVDGVCSDMSLGRGAQANGAWHLTVNNVGTGCHRYVFAFKDSAGVEQIYPTNGSLTIGNGSAQCPDFSEQAPRGCAGFDRIFASGIEL